MMPESIEDQILRYPTLSSEEQRAVEARAAERPEWQALLREAKGLEGVLADARLLMETPLSDEALAHYLVTERLAAHPLPEAVQKAFERAEAHLDEHPKERALLREFEERLDELEAGSVDPAQHFEELTGLSLDDEPGEAPSENVKEPEARYRSERAPDRAADRSARESARIYRLAMRWSRRAAVAALVLIGLYGVLSLVSRATLSDTERLAAFSEEELSVQGYRMRGGGNAASDTATADFRYLRALNTLRQARSSTLGLFPRYDAERLRRAEHLLQQVVGQTQDDAFLHLEALYFLGKTQLALGRREAARTSLRSVISGQGRKASAARKVLRQLESG